MKDIELNKIFHQPIRTRLMAYLINSDYADYTTLKKTLNLSDGHMSTHMKELLSNEYVEMKKEFVDNKPKTTYSITQKGKKEFKDYIKQLQKIISG